MPILRIIVHLLLIAIITSSAAISPALAKRPETSDEDKARAAAAFKTGQKLFADGEYLAAAASFERAYQLFPHPSSLANMGFCYDEVGDYERAVIAFRKYMRQPNPQTPEDTHKISTYLKKMKSRVGDLTVSCSMTTCEVTVDNISRGVTPTSIVLLAGTHSVTVSAVDGSSSRDYTVTVPGGDEVVLAADLSPVQYGPLSTASPKTDRSPLRLRPPFWIATSVTIAGLTAVTVLGVLNYYNRKEFREGNSEDPELKKRGDRLTLGTNLAIGFTVAAATTAVVLAIIDLRRSRNKTSADQGHSLSLQGSRRVRAVFHGSSIEFHFGI